MVHRSIGGDADEGGRSISGDADDEDSVWSILAATVIRLTPDATGW